MCKIGGHEPNTLVSCFAEFGLRGLVLAPGFVLRALVLAPGFYSTVVEHFRSHFLIT